MGQRTGVRRSLVLAAAGSLALVVAISLGVHAVASSTGSSLEPSASVSFVPVTSTWTGYAATGRTFSEIKSSWIVPRSLCPRSAVSSSATWVGIDGAASGSTMEQAGTDSACRNGVPLYYVWYELYGTTYEGGRPVSSCAATPKDQLCIPHSPKPGDTMTAAVSVTGTTWTLRIADQSRGWVYVANVLDPRNAKTGKPPAQASAEWIVERDDPRLTDFGTVTFKNAFAVGDGESGWVSLFDPRPLRAVDKAASPQAEVSALSPRSGDFVVSFLRND